MSSAGIKKVLILGLDGSTWDVFIPLSEEGVMPNLKSLLQQSSWGKLISVIPPVTATSWSSFCTGLNPGKHGVFEFLLRRKGISEKLVSRSNPFGEIPANSTLRDGKALWVLADESGLRSIVIGVPLTYPPEKINGLIIGDFLTPLGKRDFVEPPSVLDELERLFGPYKLYHRQVYSRRTVKKVIEELHDILDFNLRVALHLMKTQDWDLFFLHIWGTDRAQHELWHLLDPDHPNHDPSEANTFAPLLKDFYRKLDEGIAMLLDQAGNGSKIIASDHGFGPIRRFFNMNVWLLENHYLDLKKDLATFLKSGIHNAGMTPVLFYRIAMALGLAKHRLAGGFHSRQRMQILLNKLFLSLNNVDWEKTWAYSRGNYGQIYINLKGREPFGIVAEGSAYEKLRQELREKLLSIQDADGNQIFDRVYMREEIYKGPYVDEAPDIVLLPKDMSDKALGTLDFTSNRFLFPAYGNSGDHRLEGILLAMGEPFRKNYRFNQISIIDVAPTIMHVLGIPIPRQVDGKVAIELFNQDYLRENPIKYSDNQVLGRARGRLFSPDEIDEVRRRLEGIGYVG